MNKETAHSGTTGSLPGKVILGVDPGLSMTGWGVISKGFNDKLTLMEYGCIKTTPSQILPERLKVIFTAIQSIINKYSPELMAIEELFFAKEARTVASVGQARGTIITAAVLTGLPIFEYNPRHVKMALTGYGSADKSQIQHMVKALLGLKDIPKPDDAADAIAIAVCHLNTNRVLSGKTTSRV